MLRYALAFSLLAPVAAQAATVEIVDLTPYEFTTVDGWTGYQIDFASIGLVTVDSITFRDEDDETETGGTTTGFDLDAIVISTGFGVPGFTASSYAFTAGTSGTSALIGTDGAGNLDNSVATLETFDATVSPFDGFVSLGNGGEITAFFTPAVATNASLFIFAADVGLPEELEFLSITGMAAVPVPAGGLLLLSGLGALALRRNKRKA